MQVALLPPLVVAAEEREAAHVDLDALRHVDVGAPEDRQRVDRQHGLLELGLPEVDIDPTEEREREEPSTGAPRHGLRLQTLGARTPLEGAWEIYRHLESGVIAQSEPDERNVRWTAL